MIIILVLNIFAVLILVLACETTIRFVYRDEPVIIIDFLLFQLRLFPTRSGEKRVKSRDLTPKGIKEYFKNAIATKKALDFLFKHSIITVRTLDIHTQENDPAKETVYNGYLSTFICALLAYLRKKSLNLKSYTQPFTLTERGPTDSLTIDIAALSTLHVIAFSLFILTKDKRKRERKIVRN